MDLRLQRVDVERDLTALRPHLVESALGLGRVRLLGLGGLGEDERDGDTDDDQQSEGGATVADPGHGGDVLLKVFGVVGRSLTTSGQKCPGM